MKISEFRFYTVRINDGHVYLPAVFVSVSLGAMEEPTVLVKCTFSFGSGIKSRQACLTFLERS